MSKNNISRRARELGDDVEEATETAKDFASDAADAAAGAAATLNEKLKTVGVDTSAMKEAAKEQVSDLQQLLIEELKARPVRTLGIAAGIGLLFGLLVTR